MSDNKKLNDFIKKAKEVSGFYRAAFDLSLGLVIIDTVVKAFSIPDENDNAKITEVCKRLDVISSELECSTMPVVHAGKDEARGARGGSAWRGDLDGALMATGDRDEKTGICSNTKLAQSRES